MKWRWMLLLAGLGLYALVLVPGFLPHTMDLPIAMLAGLTIATIALLSFDSTRVDRRLAIAMITVSLIVLAAAIVLAWQGHTYLLLLLTMPALGLGLFGLRKLREERKKDE